MRRLAYLFSLAFVFTVPWEAAIHLGAFGRLSKAMGLLVGATWLLAVLGRGTARPLHRFTSAYFLFVVWSGLTFFWSLDLSATVSGFITYVQLFALVVVFSDLYEDRHQIRHALQAFVLGAYVSSISIFVNWVTAPPTRFPEHQRIKGLGFEVDGIALIIALALPIAWHLATSMSDDRRNPALTMLNLAFVPVALFAIVLTGTRGASLALLPTGVYMVWTLRHTRPNRRLLAALALSAAFAAIAWYAPRAPLERITGSVQDVTTGDSLSGRRDIWQEGWMTFFDHPVSGVGLDAFRASSSVGKEAHNTTLSVLVETGVVGGVLFGAVILSAVSAVWGAMPLREAMYWRTQIAALIVGSLSLSLEDSKPMWILLTLAVARAACAHRSAGPRQPRAASVAHREVPALAGRT